MALKINIEKFRDFPIVAVTGRVIGVDSRKLKKKMESLFVKKIDKIIIDISETEFIDSYGLGIIIYYHTLMQKAGRELILFNNNPNPQAYMTRLLELTRLNYVFKVITYLDAI